MHQSKESIQEKPKITGLTVVLLVLLILNLCVSAGILAYIGFGTHRNAELMGIETDTVSKYTLYIGLNDKDTYRQQIPIEQAKQLVNDICAKHTGGYTVVEASGAWVDEAGNETPENSLVYTFYGITEDRIVTIMDEILIALNQHAILVERGTARSMFYGGTWKEMEQDRVPSRNYLPAED